jgi:hypothetical protein
VLALACFTAFGAFAGCNDPVPPPALGAVSFSLGGGSCVTMSEAQDLKLGTVDNRTKNLLVDGENGIVRCRVVPKSGGFDVSVSVTDAATKNDSFNLSGLVIPGTTTQVTASVFTSQTQSTYQSAPVGGCAGASCGQPCLISFPPSPDPAKPTISIGAGRIWAAFECPAMLDAGAGDPGATCSIPPFAGQGQVGYLAFENCDED